MALALSQRSKSLSLHAAIGAFVAYLENPAALEPDEFDPRTLIEPDNTRRRTIETEITRWRENPDDWQCITHLKNAFLVAMYDLPLNAAMEAARLHCEKAGDPWFFRDICQPVISRRPGWPGKPIPFRRISISVTMATLLSEEFGRKT